MKYFLLSIIFFSSSFSFASFKEEEETLSENICLEQKRQQLRISYEMLGSLFEKKDPTSNKAIKYYSYAFRLSRNPEHHQRISRSLSLKNHYTNLDALLFVSNSYATFIIEASFRVFSTEEAENFLVDEKNYFKELGGNLFNNLKSDIKVLSDHDDKECSKIALRSLQLSFEKIRNHGCPWARKKVLYLEKFLINLDE